MPLGLALKGGTYVLLEADTSRLPPGTDIDSSLDGVKDVLERRVNAFGVSETEITREGPNRLPPRRAARRALTGSYLKPNADVVGPPTAVAIEFSGDGGLLFEQITGGLVGLPLGIFLDGELISAPTG